MTLSFFTSVTNKGIIKKLKPFLTDKGYIYEAQISIEVNDELVYDVKIVTGTFEQYLLVQSHLH